MTDCLTYVVNHHTLDAIFICWRTATQFFYPGGICLAEYKRVTMNEKLVLSCNVHQRISLFKIIDRRLRVSKLPF
ncbi:hypothetical protein D3C87_1677480 [compost metagenome]